jgi:hypothetical protein
LINPQDQILSALIRMIAILPENDKLFIKKIVECLAVKAEMLQTQATKRKYKASEIAGAMAHCKTSTKTFMLSKQEEIELEERKFSGGSEK